MKKLSDFISQYLSLLDLQLAERKEPQAVQAQSVLLSVFQQTHSQTQRERRVGSPLCY